MLSTLVIPAVLLHFSSVLDAPGGGQGGFGLVFPPGPQPGTHMPPLQT
jgi:hypothetical protein